MKSQRNPLLIFLAAILFSPVTLMAVDDYAPGPDSKPQPDVPHGAVVRYTLEDSKIFPGTRRDYWVYVPAEYTPDQPACVYIGQDKMRFNETNVFDNLIYRKEMPVTIGVFVEPGVVKAADTNAALDRYNRSYEYDGLGDNYARFLLEELLPAVEKTTLPDGRPIRLSHSGNDRAIGGASSGSIAAFTAAWERPKEFSRVFSSIGTYVDLRGGARYPTLIRKFEPKPIRIFLQDGSNDHNKYGGDWWMANQTMQRALVFAGYDVTNVWGDGGHTGKQATSLFPDAMRWLWREWPQPVIAGQSQNETFSNILVPGESWQLVGDGYGFTEGPAVNAKGEVYFNDTRSNKTYKIDLEGKVSVFMPDSKRGNGQAFGPDGRLYANANATSQVIAYDSGKATVIAENIYGNDIVMAHNGNIYVTDPPPSTNNAASKIWLIRPNGEKSVVDTGLKFANGIALSPDQSLLYVDDYRSHWVYSYVVQPDGTLVDKQKYYWLHERDVDDESGADGMRIDREGRLYVATRSGIQVCDQAGRVQCILPTPNGRVSNMTFGGEKFDTLFATCGDRVYKRKLKVTGANAWDQPNKPAPPKL
ncbi:MAG TPA: SMP-30/gluconolactonase/LRE family protein [Desulfuromonadaceae bacterium]|nr:SMP-30/gluconolactonase/LRE family protein [Desulfuromonadaceae bacterium]